MRIGQHSPPVLDKSTQTRETASPVTQKAPPAAPLPSTPPSAGAGMPPAQSHFGTPVRPQTSAQGRNFVTPPPPGKGKSGAKVNSHQLKQAATSAFELVYGRKPDPGELKTLEDKGQKLADEGKNYDEVKFGLHAQLTEQKTGEPVSASSSNSSGSSAATQASASTAQVNPAQMQKAISEAFTMVHGRAPDPKELKKLEGQAQQLVKEGKNYDGVKFGLHAQLTAEKTGEPVSTSSSNSSGSSAVANYVQQSVFGAAMGMPSGMGASAAMLGTAASAKPSGSTATAQASAPTVQVNPAQMQKAISEAFTMVHGRAPDPKELKKLEGQAQQLVKEGKNYDGVKFGLHAQLTAEKTGEPVSTSSSNSSGSSAASDYIKQSVFGAAMGTPATGASAALFGKAASIKPTGSTQASTLAPLRQAVDDVHQLVFGMKASGSSAQELMTHAQGLSATHGNDSGAIRNALHSLLTGKSAPAGGSPAPLSKDRLTQAMNEAHQLVFGAHPSAAKAIHLMGRALELAGQLQHDFHALKFALHSQLSGKPTPAPGGAHPTPTDSQLRQALDEAHQVAFKQAAGGPHLNAWMSEARQLATHHGNDLQAVKLALHSQMLEAK